MIHMLRETKIDDGDYKIDYCNLSAMMQNVSKFFGFAR